MLINLFRTSLTWPEEEFKKNNDKLTTISDFNEQGAVETNYQDTDIVISNLLNISSEVFPKTVLKTKLG